MTREIISHKVNEANETLKIKVVDEPGAGGVSHHYDITGYDARANPALNPHKDPGIQLIGKTEILFQNGPIAEAGVNGITQEALIAIVIDRLESFQAGQYGCRENALALTKLQEAQHWLHHRTLARMQRGVEGTHEK